MANLSDTISDGLTIQQINLLRAGVGQEKAILRMLASLERELVSALQEVVGKTDFTVGRMRELLSQTREAIGAAYGRIAVAGQDGLVDIATIAAGQTMGVLNAAVGAAVASVAWSPEQIARIASSTIIDGNTAGQWWAQQDQRLQDSFQREMQMGQLRGETVDQLAARVRGTKAMNYKDGIMEVPRRQAQALVRTSALGVANAARLDAYAANDEVVKGVQWMATLDPRTCVICMGLDGLAWDYPKGDGSADYADYVPAKRGPWAQWHKKKFEPAPIHFNCRCVVVPVTYSWKELAGEHGNSKAAAIADRIPENRRASMDGQVAASMTFDKWLGTKGEEFQDAVLGPARARAWRAGEIKLQGLADQSNMALNLKQLGIDKARAEVIAPVAPPAPAPVVPAIEELQAAVKEAEAQLPPPPPPAPTPDLPPLAKEMGVRLRQYSNRGGWHVEYPVKLPDGTILWRVPDYPEFPNQASAKAFVEGRGYKVALLDYRAAPPLSPALKKLAPGPTTSKEVKVELSKAKPAKFLPVKGESSSEAIPVELDNGKKGMFKPVRGEPGASRMEGPMRDRISLEAVTAADREVAVSDIADKVGMSDRNQMVVVPGAVKVNYPPYGVGSLQEFAPDGSINAAWHNPSAKYDGPVGHARAAAWDFFIGASDRHAENWMIDRERRMWLIDNGLSFPAPEDFARYPVDPQFRSEIFAKARYLKLNVPAEVADWMKKWPEIEAYMKKKGFSPVEIGSMELRLKILVDSVGKPFSRTMFGGIDVWDG